MVDNLNCQLSGETPSGAGSEPFDELEQVHRYLVGVVENLNLCPYAHASRVQKKTQLYLLKDESPAVAAERLSQFSRDHEGNEAVLLVMSDKHPAYEKTKFFNYIQDFQKAHRHEHHRRYYSVGFHPKLEEKLEQSTAYSLVSVIRRSPVPFIQCLLADAMDDVRSRAQRLAQRELDALKNAMLATGIAKNTNWVHADPVLSEDIALANFERFGVNKGREILEKALASCGAKK